MILHPMMAVALAAPELSVAYHGDLLVHPGLDGRTEVPLWSGGRTTLSLAHDAGVYWHPSNLLGFFVRTGPSLRAIGRRKGTWGASLQVGGLAGPWATTTYRVDDRGVRRTLAGKAWLTATASLELGRQTPEVAFAGWFVRPQLTVRGPVAAHAAGYDPAVQIGVRLGGGQ